MTDGKDTGGRNGRWRVRVDRRVCIGSGFCYGSAASHFRPDGIKSRPVRPVAEPTELLLLVADGCPVGAITLRDQLTGALVAPVQEHADD
ncbi:ferredoxin [Micromonospora zingiberis]|uniref:Ferredoxin n=1 Tax=Micromonospora zingiberis TaxID=2053011 RepID=A0A4R0GN22_9ACTN|nr:ferredoxin [Micromonospora zingiberis]TCB97863.1 ferredoxin [Micromonospora zingiberis]